MADTEHFSFTKIAAEMAKGYGRNFKTIEKAIESLPATDVAGAALLYIVAAIERLRPERFNTEFVKLTPSEETKSFPGIKVGDFLFQSDCGDDDVFVKRFVVVGINEKEQCVVRATDLNLDREHSPDLPKWARMDFYLTPEEALKDQGTSDFDYHYPKAEYAKKAIADAENGDISPYCSWLQTET